MYDSARQINEPLRRRHIGMIFQDDLLFPHISVAANVGFGLRRQSLGDRAARLNEVAKLCGVEHLLDRRPQNLSGGERQRVGLARALAPRPQLLLCDEPVSALDLPNRHALIERLKSVQRKLEIAVLYVTHSPAEAIALGTRVFLMEKGRIISAGHPLDVLTSASGSTQIALEGVRNTLTARVADHFPLHGATHLQIEDGPTLIVPALNHPPGTPVIVDVRADDILLALTAVSGVSARNVITATVERLVPHGTDVEVVVRTGLVTWIVSLVSPAVEELRLAPGSTVHMIVKARSCHVRLPSFS
jgi:molybdate transport system ATP-binding protein